MAEGKTYTITTPAYLDITKKWCISFRSGNFSETSAGSFELMLVEGSAAKDFISSKVFKTSISEELGEYDYIDVERKSKHIQTSKIIILDGSDDENWQQETTIRKGIYRFYYPTGDGFVNNDLILCKSNWIDITANQTWRLVNGIASDPISLVLFNSEINSLDNLRTWLSSNPIQVVYKLATETVEECEIPKSYIVYKNGLEIQDTNSIPYEIYKKYCLTLTSQINSNTETLNSFYGKNSIDKINENFNNYLPLSGGVINGNVTLNTLTLPNRYINYNSSIGFQGLSSPKIGLGGTTPEATWHIQLNSKKELIISGPDPLHNWCCLNFSHLKQGAVDGSQDCYPATEEWVSSKYLPLSGGTLTGDLNCQGVFGTSFGQLNREYIEFVAKDTTFGLKGTSGRIYNLADFPVFEQVPLADSPTSFSDNWDNNWFRTRSSVGTYQDNGSWYDFINVRHRNGTGDGNNYGLQIRTLMQNDSGALQYRKQNNGSWYEWHTIATIGDLSKYLPLTGGIINGNLDIYSDRDNGILRLYRNSQESAVGFYIGGECKATFGFFNSINGIGFYDNSNSYGNGVGYYKLATEEWSSTTLVGKQTSAISGPAEEGYYHLVRITQKEYYANQPIMFLVEQRNSIAIVTFSLLNSGTTDSTVGGLNSFYLYPESANGNNQQFFYNKPSSGVYDIYVKKTEPYDNVQICQIWKGDYMQTKVSIEYPNEFVETLPSTAISDSLILTNIVNSSIDSIFSNI